jgi:hypothetical protein
MTDLSNLTYEQIQELERQIEERKKFLKQSKECAIGYKVTFCVKFNPYAHQNDELRSVDEFGDWLVNDPTRKFIEYFGLKTPYEDISGFDILEMTDEDKVEWECFWENDT